MAITVASLTSGYGAVAGSIDTASITPTANSLVLLAVESNNFSGIDVSSVTGNGLTWVQIAHFDLDPTGTHSQLDVFRAMGSSPTTGVVTLNLSFKDAASWSIVEFAGVDTSGTNGSGAIVQLATAVGLDTSPVTTLSAFSHVDNVAYGAFGSWHGDAGVTLEPGTGFTELHDVLCIPEYAHVQTEWQAANATTIDAVLSITANWGAVGIEIKAAPDFDVTVNLSGEESVGNSGSLTVPMGNTYATALTSGSDSDATASATTASITPTANCLVLVAISSVNWTDSANWTVTGCNLTWEEVFNTDFLPLSSHSQLSVFRALGPSPTTGSLTLTNPTPKDEVSWSVVEFANVDTSGTNGSGAIVQVDGFAGTDASPTITLSAFSSSDNVTYAAISAYDFGQTIDPEAGWTELHDVAGTNLYTHTETSWVANDNTVVATLSAVNPWAIMALEIKAGTTVNTYDLGGVSSTGNVGFIGIAGDRTFAITGTESIPAVGTLVNNDSHGVQAVTEVGTITVSIQSSLIALTSVQTTGEVGSVAFTNSLVLDLTGVETITAVDSVGVTLGPAFTGVETTGEIGSVSVAADVNIAVSGVATTASIASLVPNLIFNTIFGVETVPAVGNVAFNTDVTVSLSGAESTTATGPLVVGFSKALTGEVVVVLLSALTNSTSAYPLTGTSSIGEVDSIAYAGGNFAGLSGVSAVGEVGDFLTTGGIPFYQKGGISRPDKFKKRPQKEDFAVKWIIMVLGSEEKYYTPMIRKHYPAIREEELSHTINNIVTSMHSFLHANPNLPSFEIVLRREKAIVRHWSLIALQTYNASIKLESPPLHVSGLLDR